MKPLPGTFVPAFVFLRHQKYLQGSFFFYHFLYGDSVQPPNQSLALQEPDSETQHAEANEASMVFIGKLLREIIRVGHLE